MKRLLTFALCLLILGSMCISASAATGETRASSVQTIATVSNDGSCQVTTTVTLHVESATDNLTFPVPVNASNVTLNGSPVLTEKTAQARLVKLKKLLNGMTGDFAFTINYSFHSVVHTIPNGKDGSTKLQLELPMLAGFAYPIDQFQFSVNLPAMVTQSPSFVSGYHQADIEKDLAYSTSGGNIAGRSWTMLKDHETLVMYLSVNEEMFPQTRVALPSMDTVTKLIYICIVVALLYWILFLRNALPIREYPAVAPEGVGAGQLGTVLTMAGSDLGLMVFSWAQLGYVVLQMDRRGRVLIHKRMEMGNERTVFEQKCFYNLFSRRDVVDTISMNFTRMHQAVGLQKAVPQFFRKKSHGSIKIFRILSAAAGLLCGTCFGIILGNMLDYGWVFMSVLSVAGLICSWQIQHWPLGLFLHHRSRLWMAAGMCVLWLALGFAIGRFSLSALAVTIQIVAGFLAAFGGRRTDEGRLAMGQTLSLRSYLRRLSSRKVTQHCQENPNFFFDMAPYAMALGCDVAFARRFGKSRLPVCPYIQASDTRGLTAQQWCQLMRQILDGMTTRQRQMPVETFRAVLNNYMK